MNIHVEPSMWLLLLKLSALSGLLMLDAAMVGQWMLAYPIFAAPLIGFLFGQPYAGFIIGILFQLFWSNKLPVGVSSPPETPLLAIVAIVCYVLSSHLGAMSLYSPWILPLLLISLSGGVLGGYLTVWIRTFNNHLAAWADKQADALNVMALNVMPLGALIMGWVLYGGLVFLLGGVFLLLRTYVSLDVLSLHYTRLYVWILAALGFAAIVELFEVTKRYRWLFFGLGAGLIVGLLARWLRG